MGPNLGNGAGTRCKYLGSSVTRRKLNKRQRACLALRERQQLRQRALELARVRALDFIDAPNTQMQLAGRLSGHCCVCWKKLTDPVSLERAIGPDCYAAKIKTAKHLARDGRSPELIAVVIGMPVAFVNEILSENVRWRSTIPVRFSVLRTRSVGSISTERRLAQSRR
jgi:Family of unknown function (DUF6011)